MNNVRYSWIIHEECINISGLSMDSLQISMDYSWSIYKNPACVFSQFASGGFLLRNAVFLFQKYINTWHHENEKTRAKYEKRVLATSLNTSFDVGGWGKCKPNLFEVVEYESNRFGEG